MWTVSENSGDTSSSEEGYSMEEYNMASPVREYTATPVDVTATDSRVSLLINSSQIRENAVLDYIIQIFGNIDVSRGNSLCKHHGYSGSLIK